MQQEMTLRGTEGLLSFFFFFQFLPFLLFKEYWQICKFSRETISEDLLI